MDISKISSGKKLPHEINVIIEIPGGGQPVKYEFDKESGALFVDRFMQVSMSYPCNYGFIPHTLSEDGDPCDVLVLVDTPVIPGCVIKARPIGVLMMEDEAGFDEKILAVPMEKEHPYYANIKSYKDLPEITLRKIKHFFENYKSLEEGKWVKVKDWEDADKAKELITRSVERAASKIVK
jgi:inorganic pyrophosphatase